LVAAFGLLAVLAEEPPLQAAVAKTISASAEMIMTLVKRFIAPRPRLPEVLTGTYGSYEFPLLTVEEPPRAKHHLNT
jgi:hypothetical protein